MKKHDCIDFILKYTDAKGFESAYDIFQELFPMDTDDSEVAFWSKAPVTSLRKMVDVIKVRTGQAELSGYNTERQMPSSIREIEIDDDEYYEMVRTKRPTVELIPRTDMPDFEEEIEYYDVDEDDEDDDYEEDEFFF